MQYNYLVDARTRMGMKNINWLNAILVFDEAHNVEVTSQHPEALAIYLHAGTLTCLRYSDRQALATRVML